MDHPVFFENQLIFCENTGWSIKKGTFLTKNGGFFPKKVPFFMEHPVFSKISWFLVKNTGWSIKNGTFLTKNGAFFLKNVPFFMEHPVFPKILNFGPNFHHLFATIT